MEQRKLNRREPAPAADTEQLLATHYHQLLKWGAVLTRGDMSKAQDIVQEFCLYFTLTKPDLSEVANVEGYLYTCLRHIYLSDLARASREALRFVSVADFDSFDFAIATNQVGDPLQRQNDLRRICGYAVWRKERSKSASYFILHFFHGYSRREIAELACLPISAIYNKLKAARSEVRTHLDQTGKLRIIDRDSPPATNISWSLLPPAELFKELRTAILRARMDSCLPEEALLVHYRASQPNPLPCSLLSHIVSCERCLDIIDRHFRRPTLVDREPLDSLNSPSEANSNGPASDARNQMAMLNLVRKRWGRVHEHRPNTLSIAVDGKIIAFHDVQSEHSMLSARIESPSREQFVEVFSEQDVRLALLSIGELPPDGPNMVRQYVSLSDSRWLELILTFDGLGLNSQVTYFDPALAIDAVPEEAEGFVAPQTSLSNVSANTLDERPDPNASWISTTLNRFLHSLVPSSAMAWAFCLAVMISIGGYLFYRHTKLPANVDEVLNRSIKTEAATLQGQTEHQVIRVEEAAVNGQLFQQGTIDLWKDGDGTRYARRLYDSQHHLIAATWRNKKGEHSSYPKESNKGESRHRVFSFSEVWDQDLSAHAFKMLGGDESFSVRADGGYELTAAGPIQGHPKLVSATLELDSHFHPIRQTMRIRKGNEVHEIRFVQTSFEHKPISTVPDSVFDLDPADSRAGQVLHDSLGLEKLPDIAGDATQLAQLQIAVLFQLNSLGADIGEPIEVVRTPEAHLRVSGAIADNILRQQIVSRLMTLKDHQLLDLRLTSTRDLQGQISGERVGKPQDTSVYEVGVAKPLAEVALRNHFQAKGLSGDQLNSVMGQYLRDALQHAQRALQNAYALNRLGSVFTATELNSIDRDSQRQWTEMVYKHAADLDAQLRELHNMLATILPPEEQRSSPRGQASIIESAAQFNDVAGRILHQTQILNSNIGGLFTATALPAIGKNDPNSLLITSMNAIPLQQAEEIMRFAIKLKSSEMAALPASQSGYDGEGVSQ